MKINISLKNILLFLLVISILSLCFAYIAEYFFGLKPCILCLYQRIPYFIIVFISGFSLFFFKKEVWQKFAIIFCILSLFVNFGIAFYHVGIEQKVFKLTEKCEDNLGKATSVEELKNMLKNAKLAKCDEPKFFFLGITMAAWNMIFSFSLGIFGIFLLKRSKRKAFLN